MNVLDENIIASQRQLLQSWRISFRQIGRDVGRAGTKDEEIIPLLHTLRNRMREAIEGIIEGKDGKKIIIVGHGGIFIGTTTDLCPDMDPQMLKVDYHNCAISEIEVEIVDGTIRGALKGWGFCSHLTGEAAGFISGYPIERAEA